MFKINIVDSKLEKQIERKIFFIVVLISLFVSGARLSTSDENAIYLLSERLTNFSLDVPNGIIDNGSFHNGKFYIWAEIGEAILILPFIVFAKFLNFIFPFSENFKILFSKGIVSTFNAFIGGLIAVFLYKLLRKFSVKLKVAIWIVFGLCFSTFLFPYFKTIIRDVQIAFFLLLAFYFLYEFKSSNVKKYLIFSGISVAFGFLVKMTFLLNVPFLSLYLFFISKKEKQEQIKNLFYLLIPLFFAFMIFGTYNYLRFQNFFETGYHGGTSFSTPLYVGLYGLLFSSGKGMFVFAPLTILIFYSTKLFFEKYHSEAILIYTIIFSNLILYAKYIAWGGDGSWGPRYLISILPLFFIPIGVYLNENFISLKKIFLLLFALGILIQIGGVSTYFGNYLRSIGEFPYTKKFDDKEFMQKSHFNPNYSPIVGHWKMFQENFVEHINGNFPKFSNLKNPNARIPISQDEEKKLLKTFDFWFMYAIYIGISSFIILILLTIFILTILLLILNFHKMLHLIGDRN